MVNGGLEFACSEARLTLFAHEAVAKYGFKDSQYREVNGARAIKLA